MLARRMGPVLMGIVKSLLAIALLIGAVQAWVRLAPLPAARFGLRPGPSVPGLHRHPGGVTIVRPLAELPPEAQARLEAIIAATPRTCALGGDPAAFVTRSRFWGFPDIALVWSDDRDLHLHSELVFGRRDMGVNTARARRWFAALEAQG